MLAFVENGKVKLFSRNGKDFSKKFAGIAESLKEVKQNIVLDGEVVAFNDNGISDFGLLQERIKHGGLVNFVVFDLLALGDKDLRNESLEKRRKLLEEFMANPPKFLTLSSGVIGQGEESFFLAKKLGFEGIVAKKLSSNYQGKRSEDWLKIKCYKRQEFVIVGYTQSDKNKNLSAILLGYYDKGKLIYVGKVGTGFSEESRKLLDKEFKKIVTKNEFVKVPEKNAILLEPKLVAEIQFAEVTKDNLLRQASFVGLRIDKDPKDVTLEVKNGK